MKVSLLDFFIAHYTIVRTRLSYYVSIYRLFIIIYACWIPLSILQTRPPPSAAGSPAVEKGDWRETNHSPTPCLHTNRWVHYVKSVPLICKMLPSKFSTWLGRPLTAVMNYAYVRITRGRPACVRRRSADFVQRF
jgi:hypothetical protein